MHLVNFRLLLCYLYKYKTKSNPLINIEKDLVVS